MSDAPDKTCGRQDKLDKGKNWIINHIKNKASDLEIEIIKIVETDGGFEPGWKLEITPHHGEMFIMSFYEHGISELVEDEKTMGRFSQFIDLSLQYWKKHMNRAGQKFRLPEIPVVIQL
jgi:hypothetical protein